MSVQYCHECHKYIDTDYDVEHFDENGECDLKNAGLVESWATKERERIFSHPEEYKPEEHHMLFSDEELQNLSQSLRGGI